VDESVTSSASWYTDDCLARRRCTCLIIIRGPPYAAPLHSSVCLSVCPSVRRVPTIYSKPESRRNFI